MRAVVCILAWLSGHILFAQSHTLHGFVKDNGTGEPLVGANVYVPEVLIGTNSNTQGFYSLTIPSPSASVLVVCSYVGFHNDTISINIRRDTLVDFNLRSSGTLREIEINASHDPFKHAITSSDIIRNIKTLPALLGEADVIKSLQLLPGVQAGYEGTTGYYVRGGGPGENLILLDGVPIHNASHVFGLFSTFNPDAINHIEFLKSGIPARYGGRLSSVLDISTKNGNIRETHGNVAVGIISSKATVEGPIRKEKSSFFVSARRTYLDLLAQPIIRSQNNGSPAGYNFHDLNIKVNYSLSTVDHIYLSSYYGRDKGYLERKESFEEVDHSFRSHTDGNFGWSNLHAAVRWEHVYSPRLFSNLLAYYSSYQFGLMQEYQETQNNGGQLTESFYSSRYVSGIKDYAAKMNFDYFPNSNHWTRFGLTVTRHDFAPGNYSYESDETDLILSGAVNKSALEFAAYLEDEWTLPFARIQAGVRTVAFVVDDKTYHSLEPRLTLNVPLFDSITWTVSYTKMMQYIHLLTNAGLGLPTDLWVPSTANVKPESGSQVATGFSRSFGEKLFLELGFYYKFSSSLVDYRDGASYLHIDGDWEQQIVRGGIGRSYGAECLLKLNHKRFTGLLGYTLARTTRQFEEINFGDPFPFRYDRRHNVSVTSTVHVKENARLSLTWLFSTGIAITLPLALYPEANDFGSRNIVEGLTYYHGRNSSRMPPYHRLDLGYSWWKNKKSTRRIWTLAIYNAYNRLNPFFITLETDYFRGPNFFKYSLFPIVPSISYALEF